MPVKTLSNTVGNGAMTNGAAPNPAIPTINQAIPGLDLLTKSATGNIDQLLNGLPSADATRTSNAYFGVNSGMPSSDFVRNRGFDLYGQQAEGNKQRGLQDLLSLVGGLSGTVAQTPGQMQQGQQFNQQLGLQRDQMGQNESQFSRNLDFQKWLNSQELGLQGARIGTDLLNSYMGWLS